MKFNRFEDIQAWQKAGTLNLLVYNVFKDNKDFGFKDQIRKASVSVMNNIAEGFERKGNKEFKRFLYMAKGSVAEVRSMLYLAYRLDYLTADKFKEIYFLATEIAKMLSGLIRTL